jgi:endoglucanase
MSLKSLPVVKLEAQFIDIGASDKKEAEKLVRVGDIL